MKNQIIGALRDDIARIFGTCVSACLISIGTGVSGHLLLSFVEYFQLVVLIFVFLVLIFFLRRAK
ncbi:MAG: hypothetical protein QM523_06655 [Candidatus Pacebacteria bacterium]|nr:hypothetical protein [Candidatus Paceibacterota bacterium]